MDPAALDRLTDREKVQVMDVMNEMQVQESMNTYNNLVERCFGECINTFRQKPLDKPETSCVENCVKKIPTHCIKVTAATSGSTRILMISFISPMVSSLLSCKSARP